MSKRRAIRWAAIAVATSALWAAGAYVYYYQRWQSLWSPARPRAAYAAERPQDDTLRVAMIGDSWAAMHHERGCDSTMQALLAELTGRPAVFRAKGRGGAKSKEVFAYLFGEDTHGNPADDTCSTRELMTPPPDYCIVMAGINDAAGRLGYDYYWGNYRCILRFLLGAAVRPVVVVMPKVGLREYYVRKPLHDMACDALRAAMTGSALCDVTPYGEALLRRLDESGLADSVLTVRKEDWCERGYEDERELFLADGIHLNARGYAVLDSCIATAIAADVARRRASQGGSAGEEGHRQAGAGGCPPASRTR